MKNSTRDVRLKALLLTGALVVAGGLGIAWLPDKLNPQPADSVESRAAHARDKTESEIDQRFERGVALLNEKQYQAALKEFHRVLELSPTLPEAHVNAGYALLGLKRYSVARDFFEGALALRKNQLNAYYGLAEALAGLNDLPGALGAMRTFVHLSLPGDPYRHKAEAAVREWEAKVTRAPALSGASKAEP
jgi:tetratricopeptide (TPR) repeat protein